MLMSARSPLQSFGDSFKFCEFTFRGESSIKSCHIFLHFLFYNSRPNQWRTEGDGGASRSGGTLKGAALRRGAAKMGKCMVND